MARIIPQRMGVRKGRMIITHQANKITIRISFMVRSMLFPSLSWPFSCIVFMGS
jgi:hypothetical protein